MEMLYYRYPRAPFLKPGEVVADLDLEPGKRVLDFGAGAGYWAIPLAEAVGTVGHVFVTDPKPENLSVIKGKAEKAGLDNLSYFHASYDAAVMPINTKVDLILCSNVLSLVKNPDRLLDNFKKLSKSGTSLVVVDWNEKTVAGPRKTNRINTEEMILKLSKLGFEFKKLLSAGAHHTGLYFVYQR